MKKILKSIKILTFIAVALFVSNSCSNIFDNPMKDKETGENLPFLLLDQNFFETKLMIHLIDAQTGKDISSDIIVYLTGNDSQKIVDFNGKHNENYRIKNGYFELAVDPSIVPSVESPLNLIVFANNDDYTWYSLPTEVSIVQSGLSDVIVLMYNQNNNDLDEIDEDILLSNLKSAKIAAPFEYSINTNNKGAKINKYSQIKYMLGYYVYFHIQPKYFNTVYESVKLTANNYSGSNLDNFGFFGNYLTSNNSVTSFNNLQKLSENKNIKNFMFYGATEEEIENCSLLFKVNITKEDRKPGSAKFYYVMSFSNGSSKTGYISANFPEIDNKTKQETYTKSVYISSIYYPANNKITTFEIFPDAQYDFTSETKQTYPNGPCGESLDIGIKAKTDLKPYKIIATIGCKNTQGVAVAPSISGKFNEKSKTNKTNFVFIGGICVIQLKENTDYTIEAKYNNSTVQFDFTTDKSKIDEVIKLALEEFTELESIKISFGNEPNDGNPQEINVSIVYKQEYCPLQ